MKKGSPLKSLVVFFFLNPILRNPAYCNCTLGDQTSILSCPGLFKTSHWQLCLYFVALTFMK